MIKLLNDIGGLIFDAVHDGAITLYRAAREPTPGMPESIYEYTARRKAADAAKFNAVLAQCNCPYCQESNNV